MVRLRYAALILPFVSALWAVDASAIDCQPSSQGTYPFITPAGYRHDRFGTSVEAGEQVTNFGAFVSVFDLGDDERPGERCR